MTSFARLLKDPRIKLIATEINGMLHEVIGETLGRNEVNELAGRILLVLRPESSLAAFPIPSDHGDVHMVQIARTNGSSLTIDDFAEISRVVTGNSLSDDELDAMRTMFGEEPENDS